VYGWTSSGSTNEELVNNLVRDGRITNKVVVEAMKKTNRKDFAPGDPYQDSPQRIGHGATISAPHMHAHALDLLVDYLGEGASVLDVGCGSGYLLAAIAHMVGKDGQVVGIDYIEALTDLSKANLKKRHQRFIDSGRIIIRTGDGWQGVEEYAPYDCIHVGAAAESLPLELVEQLKPGGRMIIPIGTYSQVFCQIDKDKDGNFTKKELFGVRYVPLVKPKNKSSDMDR